uniref:Uncharacterized protein n=1 Tax=Cacopsylla melanoneura TaxID=428564 RepID=A0A8D9B0X5_9HEMI
MLYYSLVCVCCLCRWFCFFLSFFPFCWSHCFFLCSHFYSPVYLYVAFFYFPGPTFLLLPSVCICLIVELHQSLGRQFLVKKISTICLNSVCHVVITGVSCSFSYVHRFRL